MGHDKDACEVGEIKVKDSLIPHLKKKYLIILILLGVIAVMLPSYQSGWMIILSYVFCGIIATLMIGLYTDYRFQKHHRKCRPFVMAGISKKISIAWLVFVIATTIGLAASSGEWVPYVAFWIFVGAVVLNHFQIFGLANQHKHKYPDRCEFC